MKTIQYDKLLVVRNLDALPKGGGCRYLLCMNDHKGGLIARSWHRVKPTKGGDTVIDLGGSK